MHMKIDLQISSLNAALQDINSTEWDSAVISSWFTAEDLANPSPGHYDLGESSKRLIQACAESLATGGYIFVYGVPRKLPAYAEALNEVRGRNWKLEFKYWIGVRLNESDKRPALNAAHMGILFYHKVSTEKNTPLHLNSVRVPHSYCPACGENVRDWGGKKHLLNPNGVALSDVWVDLHTRHIAGNRMPADVFNRVKALIGKDEERILHVIEADEIPVMRWPPMDDLQDHKKKEAFTYTPSLLNLTPNEESSISLVHNSVELADCIEFMESLLPSYESKAFDLVFADPPYNLDKLYNNYIDANAEARYLAWCDRWLELCARLLKPGGALYVVNLPKWAIQHSRTLDKFMQFRHWIVWQALAEPRGKLLPAHYAILYYTKPGKAPIVNYQQEEASGCLGTIDSPEYCLRQTCIKKRKTKGDDRKVPLTDIWIDIHRIRHKRDRDLHPCQLPEKLMSRIIRLSSRPGDIVFDPLCGAGTTAVVAKMLGRRYVTTDIDSSYVEITKDKLEQMENNRQHNTERTLPKKSTRKERRDITKKEIEAFVQKLALELGRAPDMDDVRRADPRMFDAIHNIYTRPRFALKAAKVVLDSPPSKSSAPQLTLPESE